MQLYISSVTIKDKNNSFVDYFVVSGYSPALLDISDTDILDMLTINCDTIHKTISGADKQEADRHMVLYKQHAWLDAKY